MPELPNAEMILQLNASDGKYGVRWSEFGGRENRQRTKEKFFTTSEARKRFCDKLEQSGNFHEFVAWSNPREEEKTAAPSFSSQIPGSSDDDDFDVLLREDEMDRALADMENPELPKSRWPWIVTYASMSVHSDFGLKYFQDQAQAQAWADNFNEMMEADPEEGAIVMPREAVINWLKEGINHGSTFEMESSAKTAKINKDVWARLQNAFPGDGDLAFSPKYQEYIVKHGYFYSHGYDEDKLAAKVRKVIPEAQVTKATNHWNAWPKDSWFEVRFKVPEAAPVAPAPAPATTDSEKPITSAKLASFHPLASFR